MALLMNVDKENPSEIEGTNVEIEGAGILDFELKGNTHQDSYTGKNLLNITNSGETINGVTYKKNEDGSITLNGTATANTNIKISTQQITQPNTYSFGVTTDISSYGNQLECGGYIYNSDNSFKYNLSTRAGGTPRTISNGEYIANFFIYFTTGRVFNNLTLYPQLEIGSTPTSFEPYVGGIPSPNPDFPQDIKVVTGNNTIVVSDGTNTDNYSLNLGSIELCKIGDYQDYIYKDGDDWYKHSEIGKVVLDGSENWISESAYSGYYRYAISRFLRELNTNNAMNNRFTQRISQGHGDYEYLYIQSNDGTTHIQLLQSRLSSSSISDFKNWLSNNNVTVYYILAVPTITEITDTDLIEQLEEISSAGLYDEINYISLSSNNVIGEFKISYSTWYKFEKILRSGYNIKEDRDRITQKFANGHRKQFLSDYKDCIITLTLDTNDLKTTKKYLDQLVSGYYKYYSLDDKEYKKAQFIIEQKPDLTIESFTDTDANINEYQVTLLRAGD